MSEPVKVRLMWEKDTLMGSYKPVVVLVGMGGSLVIEGKFAIEGLIDALHYTVERMAHPPEGPRQSIEWRTS